MRITIETNGKELSVGGIEDDMILDDPTSILHLFDVCKMHILDRRRELANKNRIVVVGPEALRNIPFPDRRTLWER